MEKNHTDKNVSSAMKKLQDALSLIILLENDLSMQHSDEIYPRIMKMLHQTIKSAQQDLQSNQ